MKETNSIILTCNSIYIYIHNNTIESKGGWMKFLLVA